MILSDVTSRKKKCYICIIWVDEPEAALGLPGNWTPLSPDERSSLMMRKTLTEVRHQNHQIRNDLGQVVFKVNLHSSTFKRHDEEVRRLSAEQTDMQHEFADRTPNAELIISALLKDLNLSGDEIAKQLFTFLVLHDKYFDIYLCGTRFVNIKNPQANSNSLILEMISSPVCDKVLTVADQK